MKSISVFLSAIALFMITLLFVCCAENPAEVSGSLQAQSTEKPESLRTEAAETADLFPMETDLPDEARETEADAHAMYAYFRTWDELNKYASNVVRGRITSTARERHSMFIRSKDCTDEITCLADMLVCDIELTEVYRGEMTEGQLIKLLIPEPYGDEDLHVTGSEYVVFLSNETYEKGVQYFWPVSPGQGIHPVFTAYVEDSEGRKIGEKDMIISVLDDVCLEDWLAALKG